jgi:transcriptional antiterminator RfaH
MGYWAVARTLVRRERFAADHLLGAGFEVFAPRTATGPLFPGYLFVRIGLTWRVIDRTIGVLDLVKFGEAPARCPEREVEALMDRVDTDGLIRLPPPPKPARRKAIAIGAKVKVTSGPFRGFVGVYAGQTARERERILIDLLGRQARVELLHGQLVEQGHLAAAPRSR